ncbi:reverse transcriptase domain-containing protein [Tanacetum coccineum]|uniref:Reverse transcriptase domain-containing protein n=1 Tax=Tanacetum coccineum TaxID=301880 RepID=A0ABQ5B3F9_9ASTR
MNYYEPNPCYDSNYSGFDQIEPPQFPVIHQPPQEMSIQDMEDLKQQYLDEMKTLINEKDYRSRRIDIEIKINELKENFNEMSIEINKKKKLQQLEQEYIIAITPEKPVESLIMKDEHLDTILETESDEFIKSSVENLVPTPSESEDFSYIKSKCDVPDCDDSQTTNFSTFFNPLFDDSTSSDDESSHEEVIHEMSFKTYSNPLFDLDKEITSINHDTLMASPPKIDFLLNAFTGELTRLQSIPPGIDNINLDLEGDILFLESLLYDNSSLRPPEAFQDNSNTIIESLSTFPIPVEDSDSLREEIDIFSGPDDSIPPGIESDDFDSEDGDNSTSLPIILGHAGLVQRAKLLKENVFILDPDGALMSTQEYMQKVVEDVGEDADFNIGAWVSATNYVNAFGGTVTGCLGDIDNFLKKGKLEQVVAIVKSCSPNALGDLNVTLKDLSGTVPGTINYKVLDVGSYGKDITVGAAMILANVSVFTPKPSKHYLNITKRNVVEVFRKDTVLGSGSG